jgi:hypothetical protein
MTRGKAKASGRASDDKLTKSITVKLHNTLPACGGTRTLIDSLPHDAGVTKDFIMKKKTTAPSRSTSIASTSITSISERRLYVFNLDPISRRLERPDGLTDIQFYDGLMLEADSLMWEVGGDLGLCLFEQAYELARDSIELDSDACLYAAIGPYQRGFFELAYKMFEEMTNKALEEKDVEQLRVLSAFLSDCGGFAQNNADNLREKISAKHPEIVIPRLPQFS